MKQLSIFIIILILSLISFISYSYAWDENNPDDPLAQTAAEQAVSALGPTLGSLTVKGDVLTINASILNITGLNTNISGNGMALKASIENLNKAIKNLNAEVLETKIIIEMSSDILFDFDKANLKKEALPKLNEVIVILQQKAKQVEITGHTDSKGSDAYNYKLSERRADSVKSWLVTNSGLSNSIFTTIGKGETEPVADNTKKDGSDNPEGRAKNRRVEIVVKTK